MLTELLTSTSLDLEPALFEPTKDIELQHHEPRASYFPALRGSPSSALVGRRGLWSTPYHPGSQGSDLTCGGVTSLFEFRQTQLVS